MELLETIVIPNYIKQIKVSNKRRPKYYTIGTKNIPKRYDNYPFEKFGKTLLLCEPGTKTRVIANPRSVGTPRYIAINGNKFYAGFNNEHERMNIVYGLKDFYTKHVTIAKIEHFPIFIKYIYLAKVETGKSIADVDNLSYAYTKTFHDWLKSTKKIPEDNTRFIRQYDSEIIPVETEEERKMIILIYKYNPETTLNNLRDLNLI